MLTKEEISLVTAFNNLKRHMKSLSELKETYPELDLGNLPKQLSDLMEKNLILQKEASIQKKENN